MFVVFAVILSMAGTPLNLKVKGMRCSGCEKTFKEKAEKIKGVSVSEVSASNGTASIEFDATKIKTDDLIAQLEKNTGYTISVATSNVSSTKTPSSSCCSKSKGMTEKSCSQKK